MPGGSSAPRIVWPSGLLQEQPQVEREKDPTGNSDDYNPTEARDVHGAWTLAAERLAAKHSKARHSLAWALVEPRMAMRRGLAHAPPHSHSMALDAAPVLASHLAPALAQLTTHRLRLGWHGWAREVAGVVSVAQQLANR